MAGIKRIAVVVALATLVLTSAGCGGRAEQPLLGTSWLLTAWADDTQDPSEFEVSLDIEDGEIGGRAPVNHYGGDAEINEAGGFTVDEINQTLIAGPEPAMRAEETYFALLKEVERFSREGDTLTLSDGDGAELLVFSATE